jgi:hypothetical protein
MNKVKTGLNLLGGFSYLMNVTTAFLAIALLSYRSKTRVDLGGADA